VPLTQKALSDRLDISPSVLNRLIANKSVELPWGLEAALSVFVPSRKALLRDQLHDLALARPELSDEGLRAAIRELHGVELSRRSIAQYRKELGVGGLNRRR
jgi:DNA-directed RNA polymerase specialized sigma54-like protein